MSLATAKGPDGAPIELPGVSPYDGDALERLEGVSFRLPCGDAWIKRGHNPVHTYLEEALQAWSDNPEWMDFLDLNSPASDLKRASRDIYLHHWEGWLGAQRVLDIGCGIGRLTHPFMDRGATVIGVDADLGSLQRCAWYAARRAGKLDLHWTSTDHLPDERDFEVIVACESLCYVPNLESVLVELFERLRPGGAFLLSMEAEYGWAVAPDAPSDALDSALSGGVVDLPGDRWVRTVGRDELAALLEDAGFVVQEIVATHYLIDGPLEAVMASASSLEELLATEETCRHHPVWAPLNRIWTAIATRPKR